MEIIARIPALPIADPANRPVPRRPRSRPNRFPSRSVSVLALVAVAAWVLAMQGQGTHLQRQRTSVRVAWQPAATVTVTEAAP
jgi:hypothetical protein